MGVKYEKRPNGYQAVQWTGSNQTELEAEFGERVSYIGSDAVIADDDGDHQHVPVGSWVLFRGRKARGGYGWPAIVTDAEFREDYREQKE